MRNDSLGVFDYVKLDADPFAFQVHARDDESKVFFSTRNHTFLFTDRFIQLSASLNSTGRVWGLGERMHEFYLDPGKYTLWNRFRSAPEDDGEEPGENLFGSHPVYFTQVKGDSRLVTGVFTLNANAQDYIFSPDEQPDGFGLNVTHITTGGVLDMFFFVEAEPEAVLRMFHSIIGRP